MFRLITPSKIRKNLDFQCFQGGINSEHWTEMGKNGFASKNTVQRRPTILSTTQVKLCKQFLHHHAVHGAICLNRDCNIA